MTKTPMTIAGRQDELAAYLEKQPYRIEQDDIQLTIAKNVFPSDFGLTSSFFGHYMLTRSPADNALDMGCGSGYFAFLLKKIGCKHVTGVDFNPDAVRCALGNVQLNPELAPVSFVHSDLFDAVPRQLFGVIVFNFNYYPADGVFGLNEDGGREILMRFFSQADAYTDQATRLYIPFSEFVGTAHDPRNIAPAYGWQVDIVDETQNAAGKHLIYLLTRRT